jgi:hypothetical protein
MVRVQECCGDALCCPVNAPGTHGRGEGGRLGWAGAVRQFDRRPASVGSACLGRYPTLDGVVQATLTYLGVVSIDLRPQVAAGADHLAGYPHRGHASEGINHQFVGSGQGVQPLHPRRQWLLPGEWGTSLSILSPVRRLKRAPTYRTPLNCMARKTCRRTGDKMG